MVSLHIVDQNRLIENPKIDMSKSIYNIRYILHVSHFLVNNHLLHYSKHYLPITVNIIYSTIHIIPTTILHKIQLYPIQLYRYYNTVIIL